MKFKNKILLTLVVCLALSQAAMASPGFFEDCLQLTKKFFVGPGAHPSFIQVLEELKTRNVPESRFVHLPDLEQSVQEFKNTHTPYINYYYNKQAPGSDNMDEFLERTIEIIYTPHSSRYGHIRVRIGKMLYGYDNVQTAFINPFKSTSLFKSVRDVKKVPGRDAKKQGNVGVVFTLSEEDMAILREKRDEIEKFYRTTDKFNIPPFDGAGAKEVKLIVPPGGKQMSYFSPTPKSNFGNRATLQGKIVNVDGHEFLEAPNGFRHPISLNAKGERVVEAYSCTSSVHYVLTKILGKQFIDKAYAESFMTHLKNGAEGYLSPDAIIHYYPSSDL